MEEVMTKQEIFEKCSQAGLLQVATVDGKQPHVRTVMLYRADENGIVFHTAEFKDLYKQIKENPKAEFCFNCKNEMIRVTGDLEIIDDMDFKKEIVAHPSRGFLKSWLENDVMPDFWNNLKIIRMTHGKATVWSMEKNFEPKEYIQL